MAKFKKNPIVIEATQWMKDGDHPNVIDIPSSVMESFEIHTAPNNINECRWINTLEGGHIVTPGDWIITGVKGEQYPCKPSIFNLTYTAIDDDDIDIINR